MIKVLHAVVLTICMLLLCSTSALAQGKMKAYKRNGLEFYEAGRFQNAAEALTVYRRYKPKDDDIWYPLAVSYYNLNQLDEARNLFEGLIRAKKGGDEVYLYMGRIEHHENNFIAAAKSYKEFLAEAGSKHELYASIVEDVRRAGFGARIGPKEGAIQAYSENLGPGVNSKGDEFHPLLSPNYQDKMYFASTREGVTGGYRDDRGMSNPETGQLRSDMYAAQVNNGRWFGSDPLSALLNSSDNEVALDFAKDGQVLVYFKGNTLYSGDLHVDTFRREAESRNLFAPVWADSPLNSKAGDTDPHIYNDTTIIFASRRAGGMGGLDLYSSTRRSEGWTVPKNLGPTINTAYDERSPFLALDGRSLYFSSNRVDASVGGFDIFRAYFDDRTVAWEPAQNAGLSVNTAGDELNFRMSLGGLEGYFDSNVRSNNNIGGKDLYVAYFKEQLRAQQSASQPVTFIQVLETARKEALVAASAVDSEGNPQVAEVQRDRIPVSIKLSPLPYGADDIVITPGNIERARSVLQFLEQYPGSKIMITAHSDDSDPERFRAYFGIKRAEKFANYLIERGTDTKRIQLMSVGSSYPLAANAYNEQTSIQGQRFNRRLELHVVPAADYTLSRDYDDPKVPDFIATDRYEVYRKQQVGPLFRVEIAEQGQMFDDDTWLRFPSPSVQTEGGKSSYRYAIGAYASYSSAVEMAKEARRRGLNQADVVAYLNGLRLSPQEVITFAPRYSELAAFAASLATDNE